DVVRRTHAAIVAVTPRNEVALLLFVRAADGGGRGRASDPACDGDERQHVWQRLEERAVGRPALDVLESRGDGAREPEEERRPERAERLPPAEDKTGPAIYT